MKLDWYFWKCLALIWGAVIAYIGLICGLGWCIKNHHEIYIVGGFIAAVIAFTVYRANECAERKRRGW